MRKKFTIAIITSIILAISLSLSNAEKVEAGFFDRAKDIYNIPERLEGLQQEYDATKLMLENQLEQQRAQLEQQRAQFEQQLAGQKQQLEESRKQAEELKLHQEQLQESNEYYREQSQLLALENENLMLKLQSIEQERKSLFHILTIVIGSIIGLLLLYACSVRIWRFFVWRKQRQQRSVMLP